MTKIEELLKDKSGIRLDIGGGNNPQPGFVNIDMQKLPKVDIVWDIEKTPWPLPDECVLTAIASHILEHVNPHGGDKRLQGLIDLLITKKVFTKEEGDKYMGLPGPGFINVMNEVWRVLKPKGQFAFVVPYAESFGMYQDPTHCLLDGAEVLTADGFKDFKKVKIGEDILTMRLEDGSTELSKCVKVINKPYNGEILRFKNRVMDIAVTPNHDLIWKTWQPIKGYHKTSAYTFEKVGAFARRGIKTIPDWAGICPDVIRNEDFMELLGWYLSEGNCTVNPSRRVIISQGSVSNPDKYSRIANLLDRLKFSYKAYKYRFVINEPEIFDEFQPLGKSADKYIPQKYKNYPKNVLIRLLEGLILGDGEQHPHGGGNTYTTISPRLAKDVSEIAVKCGLDAVIRIRKGKKFISPNGNESVRKDQYRVSVTFDNPMLYSKPVREKYKGNIVCVQVEKNNTILTRYNGHVAWVGNCNFINEATMNYFDPLHPSGYYQFYQPKPWKVIKMPFSRTGVLECLLEKRVDDKSYHSFLRPDDITKEDFKVKPVRDDY